jgi:hypothetical protein
MDASGSSCCQTTKQESVLIGEEDPYPHLRRGQLAIAPMNLSLLALL